MAPPFPPEVESAASRYRISPALAFGLGEGLNLYYSRRPDETPPHRLRIMPPSWEETLARRVAMPRERAIVEALVGNAHGVMVCTGDWHGLDAIEKWGEDLSLWPLVDGWESSVTAAVALIQDTGGLYRSAYGEFLAEASRAHDGLAQPRILMEEIAGEWLAFAGRLREARELERLGSRLLRLSARESRFWGMILDRFGKGI
jgi:hypothetical protein